MSLGKYHQKRNFKLTPEPYGARKKKASKLLYLIQKHAASHLHYDLRLEMDGVLKSWAVPKGPSLDPRIKRLAVQVEDHPLAYGSFEGIIPAGQYGGGTVMLWDTGTWKCTDLDMKAAYKKGHLSFTLEGKKLKGSWKLIRLKNNPKNWLLIKEEDKYSVSESEYSIEEEKPNSVKKKISKTASMPATIHPELAVLVNKPPTGSKWLHEIKFDGYRILSFIKGKKVRLITRNQQDWTRKFTQLAKALLKLPLKTAIFDGELVALNAAQHSDFQLLQNSIQQEDTSGLIYYIFDLIYLNGEDLSHLPLLERKKKLRELVPTSSAVLRYSDHIIGQGEKLLKKSCQLHLEGIISKNSASHYEQKRSHQWLKVKCIKRQEFLVVGFTKPQGQRDHFGSLLLAVHSAKQELQYCGKVGTGFSAESLKNMAALLEKYKTPESPFRVKPKGLGQVFWIKPKVVVEVEFTEWTKDGSLRHPSFKGIRSDKKTTQIIHEKAKNMIKKGAQLTDAFTHPEKILYPDAKISKLELGEYYLEVAKWILPYLSKRPLTIVRCPQGSQEKCFFQKHVNDDAAKGIYSILIQEKTEKQPYLYIKDEAGLMALVQLSTLEIHFWGCHIDKIEKPDSITFDLDPSPEVEWKKVIEAAYFVKEQLEKLKLISFVKTTGGKGLHVVIPIKPLHNWKEIEIFAHSFVDYLVSLKPDLYLANMSKAKRKNKIFLDYLRNQRGATAIAPYSTRAKENAPVAMALDWNELSTKIKSDSFNLRNVAKRLQKMKKDPWEDFIHLKQKLVLPSYK